MTGRSIIFVSVGLAWALVIAGCDRMPGRPTAASIELKPEQVQDFTKLYNLNCAGCHGVNGRGNAALALNNPVYLSIVSDDVLRRTTAMGVQGTMMPAFLKSAGGTLTGDQIGILVREMRARWGHATELQGETPPPYAAQSGGNAERGAKAYEQYCVTCHGANGVGGTKAKSIVESSYLALVSDQTLRMTIIAGRPDLGHPDWRHYTPSQPITGPEVTDLVAWLAAKRVTNPGRPYSKSN